VRIEELCWVLEPQRLAKSVAGIERWSVFKVAKGEDPELKARFDRQ